jgi:hypothetical protein
MGRPKKKARFTAIRRKPRARDGVQMQAITIKYPLDRFLVIAAGINMDGEISLTGILKACLDKHYECFMVHPHSTEILAEASRLSKEKEAVRLQNNGKPVGEIIEERDHPIEVVEAGGHLELHELQEIFKGQEKPAYRLGYGVASSLAVLQICT